MRNLTLYSNSRARQICLRLRKPKVYQLQSPYHLPAPILLRSPFQIDKLEFLNSLLESSIGSMMSRLRQLRTCSKQVQPYRSWKILNLVEDWPWNES